MDREDQAVCQADQAVCQADQAVCRADQAVCRADQAVCQVDQVVLRRCLPQVVCQAHLRCPPGHLRRIGKPFLQKRTLS